MRWVARTIGLILLGTYPVGLSAQVVSYSDPPPSSRGQRRDAGGLSTADRVACR